VPEGRSVGRRGLARTLRGVLEELRRDDRSAARVTPPAALVAVPLDLPAELVGDEVDRVLEVAGGVLGAQRHALQVQGRLRDLAVRIRGVALRAELHLEHCQRA